MTDGNPKGSAAPSPVDERDHYRVAFDNSHEAIVILQDGRIRMANRSAARLSGFPLENLIGTSFVDLVHHDDHAQVIDRYERRLAGDLEDSSLVSRIVRASGEVAWIEAHSTPTHWEGRPAVLAFLGDVTDREGARRDAADAANRLQRIAEIAPYFFFIDDYDLGRDVYINRSVPDFLGYSREEEEAMQPYPFMKLCHPDDLEPALNRDQRWQGVTIGDSKAIEFRLLLVGNHSAFRRFRPEFL